MMRRIEWGTIAIVLLWIVVLLLLANHPTQAQDNKPTVCRDTSYGTLRFEFRNIPLDWFVWNSDAPSWGYWADGVAMDTEKGIMIADALTVDTDGYLADTAVLVNYTDGWTLVGDKDTAACDAGVEPTATPEPIPTIEVQVPVIQQSISQPVVSTGRTCVAKYLENKQIILVCNG